MRILMRCATLALAALVVTGGPSAKAQVIYSNFGPGDAYASFGGYRVSGQSVFGDIVMIGARFTATQTANLGTIEAPFSRNSAAVNLNISLYADNGSGQLGGLIETISNQPLPISGFATLLTANSTLHPLLTAGSNYFVVAAPADPATWANWSENTIGATGTVYINTSGAASYSPASTLPALRVSAVPEPSPLLLGGLFGVGALGYTYARRR